MKRALQCRKCSIIIHKRCEPMCQAGTRCIRESAGGTDSTDGLSSQTRVGRLSRARANISSKGKTILSYPKRAAYVGASFLQQRLRNRKQQQSITGPASKYMPFHLIIPIFFPRVILYNFFLLWLIYGGLGFWSWGLILSCFSFFLLGFWGGVFLFWGFGACGVGPSGFFWLGLSI